MTITWNGMSVPRFPVKFEVNTKNTANVLQIFPAMAWKTVKALYKYIFRHLRCTRKMDAWKTSSTLFLEFGLFSAMFVGFLEGKKNGCFNRFNLQLVGISHSNQPNFNR